MKTFIFCLSVFFISASVNAQILNPKKALEKKANKEIEKKIDEVTEKPANDEEKPAEKPKEQPKTAAESKPTADSAPSLQAYSKFDFIPGEKVIFYDDFSQDNVGDFPVLWNTNGSAEIVSTNLFPGKWMKFSSRNAVWTDALLNLPDNYTIEFDVIPTRGEDGGMGGYHVLLMQAINAKAYDHGSVPGKAGFLFTVEYFGRPSYRSYINGDEGNGLGLNGTK